MTENVAHDPRVGRAGPRRSAGAPLRIVYFIDSLGSGGAQRQAVELARELVRRHGVRVVFGVYHDIDFHGPKLREVGIPVVHFHKRAKLDPTLPVRVRGWLAAERPDLVHAFLLAPSLWSLLAVLVLPRARRPVFVAGERSARIARSPWQTALQRFVYGRSDAVTVNAGPVVEEIASKLGVPRQRLHALPNGIDLATWDAEAAQEPPFTLEPERFQIALVGGLREEKNHALLLRALARIEPARRAGWRVWLVGGETGGEQQAAFVRAETTRLGLDPLVRFVPATPRIAAVMRRIDALVLPSKVEGFPNILLEAMASSIPSIATRVGDVPNMIEDGVSGLLLEHASEEALAAALLRLADAPAEARRAMGARARATVEQRYRLEHVAARHLALYRGLVAARRRSGA